MTTGIRTQSNEIERLTLYSLNYRKEIASKSGDVTIIGKIKLVGKAMVFSSEYTKDEFSMAFSLGFRSPEITLYHSNDLC